MKIFYVTVNNSQDAENISASLLTKRYAVCTNWFPIHCAYRWQGEVKSGLEVVLIIKTQTDYRQEIEATIRDHIDYTNFIAEIDIHSVNHGFANWLTQEVPPKHALTG